MNSLTEQQAPDALTCYFRSAQRIRARRISQIVMHDRIEVPPPPARVLADWAWETRSNMALDIGDVEVMPLHRTLARWPDHRLSLEAMRDWMTSLALSNVFRCGEMALMACRGARFHHDSEQYGGSAFCNLFLSDDVGLDVCFPMLDLRIPLERGTAMIFDTGQVHGVIPRGRRTFNTADFLPLEEVTQLFLTWELAIEDPSLTRALQVIFDHHDPADRISDEAQMTLNGVRATVCAASGHWYTPA